MVGFSCRTFLTLQTIPCSVPCRTFLTAHTWRSHKLPFHISSVGILHRDTNLAPYQCDHLTHTHGFYHVKYLKYPRSSSLGVLLAQLHFERRHPLLPVWVANEKNTIKPPGRAADICFPCQPRSCTAGCLFKPPPPYYSWKGLFKLFTLSPLPAKRVIDPINLNLINFANVLSGFHFLIIFLLQIGRNNFSWNQISMFKSFFHFKISEEESREKLQVTQKAGYRS